jgi:hypothetical protein
VTPFPIDQFTLFRPEICEACPISQGCQAQHTTAACRDNGPARLVDPGRSDFPALLAELGSLSIGLTKPMTRRTPELPGFIGHVDGTAVTKHVTDEWVAVNLGVWLRQAGLRRPRSEATMRQRLGLQPSTKIVLLAFGHDRVLDHAIWPLRREFARRLHAWKPDLVVAPDFSVWRGDPWLTQRINIVRSVRMVELIEEAGFPCVPHVYWSTEGDAQEWATWLTEHRVPTIAIDLQCVGSGLHGFVRELRTFRSLLPHPPRLLVSGVRPGPRMRQVQAAWPDATFTADLIRPAAKRRELVCPPVGRCSMTLRPGADPAVLYQRMTAMARAFAGGAAGIAAA